MNRSLKFFHFFSVANGTINPVWDGVTRPGMQRISTCMTLDTGYFLMTGVVQRLLVHEHALTLGTRLVGNQLRLTFHMGLVAFNTNGHLVRFRFPKLTLDHFLVHHFDQAMTSLASGRYVVPVDGGFRVFVAAHVMGRVTIRANCCLGQTSFKQPFTMDGQGIMTQHTVL